MTPPCNSGAAAKPAPGILTPRAELYQQHIWGEISREVYLRRLHGDEEENEPAPSEKTGSWSDCLCIRRGDMEDTSACEIHGETRAPAVKLAPFTGEDCPF